MCFSRLLYLFTTHFNVNFTTHNTKNAIMHLKRCLHISRLYTHIYVCVWVVLFNTCTLIRKKNISEHIIFLIAFHTINEIHSKIGSVGDHFQDPIVNYNYIINRTTDFRIHIHYLQNHDFSAYLFTLQPVLLGRVFNVNTLLHLYNFIIGIYELAPVNLRMV